MRTDWRRKLNILCMLFLLLLGTILPVNPLVASGVTIENTEELTARRGNIRMTIDYGYDRFAKYGRYMGVSAEIHNSGEDFEGWLQVITPKIEKNVVYRVKVSIPPSTTQKITLPIPVTDDSGHLQVKLTDENKNTIVERNAKIKIGNSSDQVYIGVLSEKKNVFYLDSYASKMFYMDESDFPSDYLELDMLDIIVINRFDTDKLSDSQLEAIDKWVSCGGLLVIGTGEYYKKTLASLSDRYSISILDNQNKNYIDLSVDKTSIYEIKKFILDYAENRKMMLEVIKNRNKMLMAYGRQPISTDTIVPDQWAEESIGALKQESVKKELVNVILKGATIGSKKDGYILHQSLPVGNGKVQLFSYDLGMEEENVTLGAKTLVLLTGNLSSFKREQLQGEYYGSYEAYEIYKSMRYTDAKKIPEVSSYLIILLLYLLLVGPITFIILKKLDKRSYTWIVVPSLAIVFVIIIYFFGSDTRISRPYVGYINILTYQEDNTVDDTMYFSLNSPNNKSYSIDIDSKFAISEFSNNMYNFYMSNVEQNEETDLLRYTTSINYSMDKTEIGVNKNPAFSPIYYQAAFTEKYDNQLSYDLSYTGSKVIGTITNGFDYDLTGAILVCDGNLVQIGTIEQGKTITVDEKKSLFLTSRDIFYNNDIIHDVIGVNSDNTNTNSPETDRKLSILYYLGENRLLNIGDGNFLIAFPKTEESKGQELPGDTLIEDLSKKADCYGINIAMFPVEPDYTQDNLIFVPSVDSYLVSNEMLYDSYYSPRYLTVANKTVEYHFPGDDHIVSFEYLPERNPSFESEYQQNFDGKIYFKNNTTGDFDEVFQSGVGSSVTNLNDYLTEENVLTVRFTSDLSLQAYQMFLPYISYFKEAK